MEPVSSLKIYLKFKLDSLFQQTILWRIFSSLHGFCTAILLFRSQEIPFYIQWKLSCSGRNHKDWYCQTCQTNLTAFLLTAYSTQHFLHTTGMLIFPSTSAKQNLYCNLTIFFWRRTLAFADILFLGLWQALCKHINTRTTNLASTVKTLLKTHFCYRNTPQRYTAGVSWSLILRTFMNVFVALCFLFFSLNYMWFKVKKKTIFFMSSIAANNLLRGLLQQ